MKFLPIIGVALLLIANAVSVLQGHFTNTTALLSFLGALLFLTVFLRGERGNIKTYLNVGIYTLFTLGIFIVLYLLCLSYPLKWDLTQNKYYSLSKESGDCLKTLKDEIVIYAFVTSESQKLKNFLENYRLASIQIETKIVNPFKDHSLAKSLSDKLGAPVNVGDLIVENKTLERTKKVDMLKEETITNAIIEITRAKSPLVCFLKGHGEKPLKRNISSQDPKVQGESFSLAVRLLEERGFDVKELEISLEGKIPEDCDLIICAGPQSDLLSADAEIIKEYLNKGGAALFLLDPQNPQIPVPNPFPQIASLLKGYDTIIKEDIIIDSNPITVSMTGDVFSPLVREYNQKHPILEKIPLSSIYIPGARTVNIAEKPSKGADVQSLFFTSNLSWSETIESLKIKLEKDVLSPDKPEEVKPQSIAVAYSNKSRKNPKKKTRIVTIGDCDIFADLNIKSPMLYRIFVTTVNWLTTKEDNLTIPVKKFDETPLYLNSANLNLIRILLIITFPSFIILAGLGYTLLRKKMK